MTTNTKNLSNVQGTYTKSIVDNINKINDAYNKKMPLSAFKSLIIKLVESAHDTAAKRKFIFNVNKQNNNDSLLMYIYNAELRGSKLGSNINDKFAK